MMKILATLTLILGVAKYAYGIDCFTCNDYNYNGENGMSGNCWTTTTTGSSPTNSELCPNVSDVTEYCRSIFTIQDGVATSVVRGCASGDNDHNAHTTGVPANDNCVTTISTFLNPTDRTECYFSCSTTDCNTKTASGLTPCSTNCSTPNGACNYITGTCVCNAGFSGSDCSTIEATTSTAVRACVQCNSETDSTCSSATSSVDCPGAEEYCSTAYTYIYDSSDTLAKTVTTRGCTAATKAVDECAFTDIYTDAPISNSPIPGYNEFTCYSTCATNGCNTNTANGIVDGTEAIALYCVQCIDTAGYGSCNTATTRTQCPSGTTYCKSTVTYKISEKLDLRHTSANPAFKLTSVVRECATAAVTSACTETVVGSVGGLKRVSCTETCQDDGCNTGWPNRPKCIQCSSSSNTYGDGYDECLQNPPDATDCTYPYDAFCVIIDQGFEKGKLVEVAGYPRRMTRECSSYDIGTSCSSTTIRSTEIETCNRTCTTDGCNVGSGDVMPMQTMLAVILPVLFGWLFQAYA